MHSGVIAKTAIVSSLLTLFIFSASVYAFRDTIADLLFSQLAIEATQSATVPTIEQPAVEPVVATVSAAKPAVVSVVATKDVPIFERYYETIQPGGFLGGFTIPRLRKNGFEEQQVGGGSGFIVSTDGHVVTNHHVVSDAEARYSVLLDDGTRYPVSVLDSDPSIDIAVLKIEETEARSFPVIAFGDSGELQLGQTVIAIGNVLAEFNNSVSVGVVSGLARSIVASDSAGRSEELHQIIQTDAAINPGNSGGPLLSLDGEVVGVNVATSQGAENIGFAIPAEIVSHAVSSVLESGQIVRPFLGVRHIPVTDMIAEANDLPIDYGVLIITGGSAEAPAVLPGSPAEAAGLQEGDVIVALNGESLQNADLGTLLRTMPINTPISIEVLRGTEYFVTEALLETF